MKKSFGLLLLFVAVTLSGGCDRDVLSFVPGYSYYSDVVYYDDYYYDPYDYYYEDYYYDCYYPYCKEQPSQKK